MYESATLYQVLIDIVLWLIILVLFRPAYKSPFIVGKTARRFGVFVIIVFCLFPFWGGDYFHYRYSFFEYLQGGFSSMEPVYDWIIDNLSYGSYLLFRLIVWGSAVLILFKAYKMISPSFDLCFLIFGVCYLPLFSYARVSLSMAMIILGISIIIVNSDSERRKTLPLFIGLAFIGCSEFFHRSAVIGIVAAVAAFFLVNANKKTLFLLLLVMPVIIWIMQYSMDSFMSYELDYDTYVTARMRDSYMSGEQKTSFLGIGRGVIIQNVLTRVPLYLSALLYILLVINGNYKNLSKTERAVSSYAFCVIILGLGFMMDLGYNTYILHYRTLNFALPANAVFLAAVRRHNYNRILFNIIWWLTAIGVLYAFLYSAYCAN